MPSTTAVDITPELNEKLISADDTTYHEIRKPFVVSHNISEESFEFRTSSPFHPKSAYVAIREEVCKLLKRIPSFTKREPLIQNTGVHFSATQRIPFEIDDYLSRFFMAQLLYGTLDIAIACIIHMQDYTAFETTIVRNLPIFCLFCFSLLFNNDSSLLLGDSQSPKPYVVAHSPLLPAGSS